ncbi:uncharacterized protein DSM5745_01714 [Aspergillus mulundensis]|uniref:Chromosome segregation protein BIR1 n=1 Tax=Aspergillus mulundensis TaxID=1810919 RepID=A0A3D8SUF4_9EURO|nr:hypothetical protein DSM5745_01714 [Aspergillus mulundensis]RDW89939.1 hypothetical protein DSM5745_01714 [Aspergillus mulundensis]
MANEMETFAARLATFDLVLHPDRRSSSSKSSQPISWPHSRPSPAELAHAGFFYNPYETNPDNTTCFLCRRALDGWEEDDNPITEHLKHAGNDCGWAVMMDIQQRSSNPAEIEDPTSEPVVQARLATFGESWPHDGKRGWLCQSEKMVEGGWYFCPNEESADLASCAYCKLSLDGWEPKDNPYDEHYRRSSDCSFFVFAKPTKGKGSRSKKARTSKASRQSTQSTASEAFASDIEDMDHSVLAPPTKAKSTKKSSKSKSKSSKTKKDEPQEIPAQMDVDGAEYAEHAEAETSKSKRGTRGRKRSSAEVDRDAMSIADEDTVEQPEPPTKKRATKRSISRARAQSIVSTDGAVDTPEHGNDDIGKEEDAKPSRGRSKTKSSKSRKGTRASSTATAKKASKSRVPRDSELDAAIEAGLDGDEPQNMEIEETKIEEVAPKPASKKPKSKKKNAKKEQEPTEDVVEHVAEEGHMIPEPEPEPEADQQMANPEVAEQQEPEPTATKSKRRSSRKSTDRAEAKQTTTAPEQHDLDPTATKSKRHSSRKSTDRAGAKESTTAPEQSEAQEVEEKDDHRRHESFVSVEIISKPPADYGEVESNKDDKKTKKKKKSSEKTKKSKKVDEGDITEKTETAEKTEEPEEAKKVEKKRASRQPEIQETPKVQSPQLPQSHTPEPNKEEQKEQEGPVQDEPGRRRSSRVPPKTAERYSDIPQEKQYARSIASDRSPEDTRRPHPQGQEDGVVSPIPSASRGSPSLSPQSSDAENHPPSLKASTRQPQPSSPSKNASVRFPLATSTPSPSKRNASAGKVQTSNPWVPINIEHILMAGANDKENVDLHGAFGNLKGELSSPEKKMTVEEWVMWNAKNGEERLKRECERLVGQFEREGARAMRALEGIECID